MNFQYGLLQNILLIKNKTIWKLKNPYNQNQKVGLYLDIPYMIVYGSYGEFVFNTIKFTDNIYTIDYNNIKYQIENLTDNSKKIICSFDIDKCINDILKLLEEKLKDTYNIQNSKINKIIEFLNDKIFITDGELKSFCLENDIKNKLYDILKFTVDLLNNGYLEFEKFQDYLKKVIILNILIMNLKIDYGK